MIISFVMTDKRRRIGRITKDQKRNGSGLVEKEIAFIEPFIRDVGGGGYFAKNVLIIACKGELDGYALMPLEVHSHHLHSTCFHRSSSA